MFNKILFPFIRYHASCDEEEARQSLGASNKFLNGMTLVSDLNRNERVCGKVGKCMNKAE